MKLHGFFAGSEGDQLSNIDTYYGGDNVDIVLGGDGNDVLNGGGGWDLLIGGYGDDELDPGTGGKVVELKLLWGLIEIDNIAYGGHGNDTFNGGPDNDVLISDLGDDMFHGGFGNDVLAGGEGRESMFGDNGDDLLFGGSDNDELDGGPGQDSLAGEDGDDILYADLAQDTIVPGSGTDIVISDVVAGTSGDDIFHVVSEGSLLQVYVNRAPIGPGDYTTDLSSLKPFAINAGDGNDTVLVNVTGTQAGSIYYRAGSGDNALVVNGGVVRIESNTTGTLNTDVAAGAELRTLQIRQTGLTLADAARVTLLAGGGTSRIADLVLFADATLDITDNALVIDYSGTSPVAMVRVKTLSGRGGAGLGKGWNGPGITSSTAAQANATASNSQSVGYAENALLPLGASSSFRGIPVDNTSVLIAYTRTADANLDGVVNDDDVTILGANYAPGIGKPAWALGDFEYNGFVNDDDVTLLGAFYNPAAGPLAAPAPPNAETAFVIATDGEDFAFQQVAPITVAEPPPARPNLVSRAIGPSGLDGVRSDEIVSRAHRLGGSTHQLSPSGAQRRKYDGHLLDLLAESVINDQQWHQPGFVRVPVASKRQSATADSVWAGW